MFDPFPFIETILANLADAAPKLVYADALDEAGFPNRAAFVRWLGWTGRRPDQRDGYLNFYREPDGWHSPGRPHTLPYILWQQLYWSVRGVEVRWGAGDWVGLEKTCATAWERLTTPGRRLLFRPRPSWVPDYTPVPDYRPNESALLLYHEGVR